jgi:hypothetical protein
MGLFVFVDFQYRLTGFDAMRNVIRPSVDVVVHARLPSNLPTRGRCRETFAAAGRQAPGATRLIGRVT